MKRFSKWLLYIMGWKVEGQLSSAKDCPSLIVVVGPHTSFMDFLIAVLVRTSQDRRVYYLAKRSLFRPPLGWLLRWLGGYPVDRRGNQGLVDSIVDMFGRRKEFAIAIAPEGTRRRVDHLRSGFYYIAKNGRIPIQLSGLDFGSKTVFIQTPYLAEGTFDQEEEKIRKFWGSMKGYHPEKGFG